MNVCVSVSVCGRCRYVRVLVCVNMCRCRCACVNVCVSVCVEGIGIYACQYVWLLVQEESGLVGDTT